MAVNYRGWTSAGLAVSCEPVSETMATAALARQWLRISAARTVLDRCCELQPLGWRENDRDQPRLNQCSNGCELPRLVRRGNGYKCSRKTDKCGVAASFSRLAVIEENSCDIQPTAAPARQWLRISVNIFKYIHRYI